MISQRLLSETLRSKVKFTGDKGLAFKLEQSKYTKLSREMANCCMFQGSPDITISNKRVVQRWKTTRLVNLVAVKTM